MAPKPKPRPPAQVWKRTGKCVVKRCQCEGFLRHSMQDTFALCTCGHTQHSHARTAPKQEGMVDS